MKVAQINTVCGIGSTGRTSVELAEALSINGHDALIAYGQATTSYKNSYKIGTVLENHFHNVFSRTLGKQGYFSENGTKKLIDRLTEYQPDIIHLRNLHGNYLNLRLLFNFLASSHIPVIWSLHDCWAFTGKCSHYTSVGCYKWEMKCHHCPQVKSYPPSLFFDRSAEMFDDKIKWFTSIENMTIIPVSNWLARETERSFLNRYPIKPVYNWIDQDIFKPTLNVSKESYGISNDKFVVLGVSAGWSKSTTKFNDFIELSKKLPDDIVLVLVGAEKEKGIIPGNVMHIPYVESTSKLAEIYALADVYVHLSREDTFGKVIAESLSCGTPAIVFNATACPELIGEGCGHIVEPGDIDGIYDAINNVKISGKSSYTNNAISFANQHFSKSINTNKIMEIYQEIIKK